MLKVVVVGAALGTLLLVAGWGPSRHDPTATGSYNVPVNVHHKLKTYRAHSSPALVSEGKTLFNKNCTVCHQADGVGKTGFAPSLTNKEFLSIASKDFLYGTIRDGRPGTAMPSFAKQFSQKQLGAIVAYLRSHGTLPYRGAAVNAEPKAVGDPKLGQTWFQEICSSCHGPKGDGYAAGGSGTAIGMTGFLSKASDGFIRNTIKYGRSNTRMRGFHGALGLANLSDSEINDIIVYLRTIPESKLARTQ